VDKFNSREKAQKAQKRDPAFAKATARQAANGISRKDAKTQREAEDNVKGDW
jgi:hypothetical protein